MLFEEQSVSLLGLHARTRPVMLMITLRLCSSRSGLLAGKSLRSIKKLELRIPLQEDGPAKPEASKRTKDVPLGESVVQGPVTLK